MAEAEQAVSAKRLPPDQSLSDRAVDTAPIGDCRDVAFRYIPAFFAVYRFSQPPARSMARFQLKQRSSRSSSEIAGSKLRSIFQNLEISSMESQ